MGDPNGNYTGQYDRDGETRLLNGVVDMGSDEWLDFPDGDDLPDWWEMLYFGSPMAADPAGDGDGDGWLNLDEYRLGFDPPRTPADLLRRYEWQR